MSIRAFKWAKTQREVPHEGAVYMLSSSERFVLLMLGDYYNDSEKRAWPRQAALADDTGLSRRTVIRAIQALGSLDLVDTEPWVNAADGSALPNRYCLPRFDPTSRPRSPRPVRAFGRFDTDGKWVWEQLPSDTVSRGVVTSRHRGSDMVSQSVDTVSPVIELLSELSYEHSYELSGSPTGERAIQHLPSAWSMDSTLEVVA